jgi:signal transduction histidine kinase
MINRQPTQAGFDTHAVMKHRIKDQLGLLGIEERVALVGGNLAIESALGGGTSLHVRNPTLFNPHGELPQCTNYES